MRPQPFIVVADVEASSRWYQQLLGCRSAHGGSEYERLVWQDHLILQLHSRDADHHHGPLSDPQQPHGNGVLLWFQTENFDAAVDRARELDAHILKEPHVNPNARHHECWIQDPDGYRVVLSGPPHR